MKKLLFFCTVVVFLSSCVEDTFMSSNDSGANPANLKYMSVTNAREGKTIISGAPTISTNNLVPYYEIVAGFDKAGNRLDESFMKYVSIFNADTVTWKLAEGLDYPVDENGDSIKGGIGFNLSKAGVISISDGHIFTVGEYYFSIKVTTKSKDQTYSTTFDKAFHIKIEPLLPSYLVYQLKTQNLVAGDPASKTNKPIIPSGNKNVSFALLTNTDKLTIDAVTGEVKLTPTYIFTKNDTIRPTIELTSNISGEKVTFASSLVVIVTDKPTAMPIETIYFFYPTLFTTGATPTGGDGFSVKVIEKGSCPRIWGERANSAAGSLVAPVERPVTNLGKQKILETNTFTATSPITTKPTSSWCVTTTQDLSVYNIGYDLSFGYLYMPAYQIYMADGRTPTDLEVYISTDYTGGDIQDANGNWTNGTWTKINQNMKCNISLANGGKNGAPWGAEFTGTPYPGDQKGEDPEGRKDLVRGTVYGKWIKCSYDITSYKNSKSFTVAFRVASYFYDDLLNNTIVPGRGGSYFLSDFHYVAKEVNP